MRAATNEPIFGFSWPKFAQTPLLIISDDEDAPPSTTTTRIFGRRRRHFGRPVSSRTSLLPPPGNFVPPAETRVLALSSLPSSSSTSSRFSTLWPRLRFYLRPPQTLFLPILLVIFASPSRPADCRQETLIPLSSLPLSLLLPLVSPSISPLSCGSSSMIMAHCLPWRPSGCRTRLRERPGRGTRSPGPSLSVSWPSFAHQALCNFMEHQDSPTGGPLPTNTSWPRSGGHVQQHRL